MHPPQRFADSIFWIETEKIKPNPYQPRKEFNQAALDELAESIRQYGILQPLVVTRQEIEKEDGGLAVEYELIAGERRLRAAKLANVFQVPVVIRVGEDSDREKLELAIIENLQREDLNPIDRARAFKKLADEFGFKNAEIGKKIGKSREYVSNTIRLLTLPEDIVGAISVGKITEGHARPLMMLVGRESEQTTLFKEIMDRRLTVREAEEIARRIAVERRKRAVDPEMREMEGVLSEALGTRVMIEPRAQGGRLVIDFLSPEELQRVYAIFVPDTMEIAGDFEEESPVGDVAEVAQDMSPLSEEANMPIDDRSLEEKREHEESSDEDLYSVKNFSL